MFECHRVLAVEEDAQIGVVVGLGRFQYQFIFLPVGRSDVESGRYEILTFLHSALVDELHPYLRCSVGGFCPDGETVVLAFEHADAEVTLVLQTRATFLVSGIAEHYIVRTTLERTVVL